MRDALFVRVVERRANLRRVLQRLIERHRSIERSTLDVLHHQVIRPDIVQGTNMGMIERGHGAGLALETLTELGLGDFDGDDTVQARIPSLLHVAHAARSDGREDFVGAESVASGKRHRTDLLSVLGQRSRGRSRFGERSG